LTFYESINLDKAHNFPYFGHGSLRNGERGESRYAKGKGKEEFIREPFEGEEVAG
jgi:hypothetical protein